MIVTPPGFISLASPVEHPQRRTFVFRGGELLVREPDAALAEDAVAGRFSFEPAQVHPVGMLGGVYCRTAWVPLETPAPEGHAFKGLRSMFGRLDDVTIAIAGRAFQIADWARNHRYCGTCGQLMTKSPTERSMRCACGHVAYPRISPAMMTLVKRGDAILLARSAAVPAGGRMSALAGFLEPGESVEDAIHREVHEEVGLLVKDLRYFGSQSWPFPNSLMIAFTAEYAGGDIRVEPSEIAEARWFGPGDPLPELSPRFSISRALIDANLPQKS